MIIVANFFTARKEGFTNQASIANTSPIWFRESIVKELMPGNIVWRLKAGHITEGDYRYHYTNQLKQLNEHKFDFGQLEGKTLLCWCKQGEFCHRYILADFLVEKLGYEVVRY